MILGRICGYVGRADIIEFGRHNQNKFRKIGMLKNGIPSEATLCRVENGIDDLALADRMQEFAANFHEELFNECRYRDIICMDGLASGKTGLLKAPHDSARRLVWGGYWNKNGASEVRPSSPTVVTNRSALFIFYIGSSTPTGSEINHSIYQELRLPNGNLTLG